MKKMLALIFVMLLTAALAACSTEGTTPAPTPMAPVVSDMPFDMATEAPIVTQEPTEAPIDTATAAPTETPVTE